MKLKHAKKNSGFTLVELLVVIAIIAALAAISSPIIIRQIARARATTAISNSKDIYVAIRAYAFKNGGNTPAADTDANTTLRTLFATGFCQDEKPFFVNGLSSIQGLVEGDGNYAGDEALADGENAFSVYERAGVRTNITNDPANTPLLGIPCVDNDNIYDGEFEMGAFGGQGVILRTDGSAIAFGLALAAAADAFTGDVGTLTNDDGTSLDAPASSDADDFSSYEATMSPVAGSAEEEEEVPPLRG